ncbi:hypothetical protein RIF29_13649 [Crotalaria pallida]|uniref:Uncharacterized protein n=1 Tax=Crotalaria pallida TaxID=3830 RepID=A0AAN9IPL5_CROPI
MVMSFDHNVRGLLFESSITLFELIKVLKNSTLTLTHFSSSSSSSSKFQYSSSDSQCMPYSSFSFHSDQWTHRLIFIGCRISAPLHPDYLMRDTRG